MSDKVAILRAFNNHFVEFFDDIISIYPDNVEILSAKTSFESIKRFNPTTIIKAWYKFIYLPYNDVIQKGDLSFFFDKDYQSDLSHLNNVDDILKIIDKVRNPLREMSDKNKDISASYLKNLTKLSNVYANL
jgi:hypothetical protein